MEKLFKKFSQDTNSMASYGCDCICRCLCVSPLVEEGTLANAGYRESSTITELDPGMASWVSPTQCAAKTPSVI